MVARQPRERRRGGLLAVIAALALVALVVGGVAMVIALPGLVRDRAIAEAARQGVVLEVRDVALGFPRLRLIGVSARLRDVPQLAVTADEAAVSLAGLAPSEVRLPRARVAIDGSLAEVVASLERAAPPPSDGAVAFTLAGDAVWRGVLGAATEATGKVTASARGAQFDAKVGDLRLAAAGKQLGPWSAEVASGAACRLSLLLDAKGAARVDLSRAAGATRFALKVPRVGPASVGVPPELLGLAGGRGEVQADISGSVEGGTRFDGAAAVRVYGVSLGLAPMPVDVAFDAAVKGDARGPMKVSHGSATIGPLRADVTGILELLAPFGVRADLTWQAGPTPCLFLPGPSLFRGGVHFDTRPAGAVGAVGAAWSARVDVASVCGVSLLGR